MISDAEYFPFEYFRFVLVYCLRIIPDCAHPNIELNWTADMMIIKLLRAVRYNFIYAI